MLGKIMTAVWYILLLGLTIIAPVAAVFGVWDAMHDAYKIVLYFSTAVLSGILATLMWIGEINK